MKKSLAADKSKTLREHWKQKQTKNYTTDPEIRFRNHWNFLVRTAIKDVVFDLPQTHPTDKDVTLYCVKARLGALDDPKPPKPQSQLAVLALASLQKAKHPHFYRKVGEKTITVYEQRADLVTQQVEVATTWPDTFTDEATFSGKNKQPRSKVQEESKTSERNKQPRSEVQEESKTSEVDSVSECDHRTIHETDPKLR